SNNNRDWFNENKLRYQTEVRDPAVELVRQLPNECFIGMGCWRPERNVPAAIRNAIDKDPKGWGKTRDQKKFRHYFELAGERLKTTPRQYDKTLAPRAVARVTERANF